MADTGSPVIKISVDKSEFDSFIEQWDEYRQDAAHPEDPFAGLASSLRESTDAMHDLTDEMAKLSEITATSKMTGVNSYSSQFSKNSKASAKEWALISKSMERSNKDFLSLKQNWFSVGGLKRGPFGLFAAATAVAGSAAATASDLANENRRNRELGLKPGQKLAFNNDFEKFGLNDSDLNRTVDAQADQRHWRAFNAAGLTPEQIQNTDPIELTAFMNKWAGGMVREWKANGQPLGPMAKSFGLNDLFDNNQLRLAGSYSDEEHDKAFSDFKTDTPKFALQQSDLDQATKVHQEFENAKSEVLRSLERAIDPLIPKVSKLATEFATAVDAFSKSKELADDIEIMGKAFDTVKPFFQWLSQQKTPDAYFSPKIDEAVGGYQGYDMGVLPTDDADAKPSGKKIGPDSVPDYPMPDKVQGDLSLWQTWTKQSGQRYSLPDGLLDTLMGIESHGNPYAVNPVTHAAGLMQFMPGTSKAMNLDPFNPSQAIFGAGSLLNQYRKTYGGSLAKGLAAYNGDTHINTDEAKFGDFLKGAKQETLNYLRTFQDKGYDLGLSPEQAKFLQEHGKVQPSQLGKFKSAKGDANLKLDPSQMQIIEVGKDGKEIGTNGNSMVEVGRSVGRGIAAEMQSFFARYLHEGGGAQFRMPDAREKAASSALPQPQKIEMTIQGPAGMNVTTSMRSGAR